MFKLWKLNMNNKGLEKQINKSEHKDLLNRLFNDTVFRELFNKVAFINGPAMDIKNSGDYEFLVTPSDIFSNHNYEVGLNIPMRRGIVKTDEANLFSLAEDPTKGSSRIPMSCVVITKMPSSVIRETISRLRSSWLFAGELLEAFDNETCFDMAKEFKSIPKKNRAARREESRKNPIPIAGRVRPARKSAIINSKRNIAKDASQSLSEDQSAKIDMDWSVFESDNSNTRERPEIPSDLTEGGLDNYIKKYFTYTVSKAKTKVSKVVKERGIEGTLPPEGGMDFEDLDLNEDMIDPSDLGFSDSDYGKPDLE